MKISKWVVKNSLWIILLIASVIRLWNLGGNPPHLTPDEASLGYNAYSILKTARDEYGEFLPVIFKSFGDFKPGLYIYFSVPSVAIFGLTEFATRLPSALAGVAAVWLVYLITNLLFGKKRNYLAPFASLFLAISPWHIHFSRGAWEVNVSLTLTLAGIYFFLRSVLFKKKNILYSVIFFALTLLTYQGAKLSTAIVLVILCALYWKELMNFDKKKLVKDVVVGLIIVSPILLSLFRGQTGRLNVFSVFSYPRPRDYTQAFLDEADLEFASAPYYIFYSETLNFTRGILGRWFNHFSTRFLFFEGDWQNPRHSAPYHGMLLLGDLLLIALGFYAFLKKKLTKERAFILLWLVLAPLPSALSRDQVHAVRSLNMVVPLTVILSFGALGLIEILSKVRGKSLRGFYYLGFIGAYLVGFVLYLDKYFIHLPIHDSKYWEYGYKQVVETVWPMRKDYEKIKVRQSFAQPYIYFLFYGGENYGQAYDPGTYQKQAKLIESEYKGDVGYVGGIDNVEFAAIDWSRDRGESKTLFVADPIRIPPGDSSDPELFDVIDEIKYLDGRETAFRIIEVK